jgi:hypothetical protein
LLLILPAISAVVSLLAGYWYYRYTERFFGAAEIASEARDRFRAEEFERWAAVSLAAAVLTAGVVARCLWRPASVWSRAIVTVALIVAFTYSCGAAFWPDREMVADGWIVHPPRLAIVLPAITAAMAWGTCRMVSKRHPRTGGPTPDSR